MAREDLHFRLRLPADLKERIEHASTMNERSMTAEIISRLQWTFGPADEEQAKLIEERDEANRRLTALREAMEKVTQLLAARDKEFEEFKSVSVNWEKVVDDLSLRLEFWAGSAAAQRSAIQMLIEHLGRAAEGQGIDLSEFREDFEILRDEFPSRPPDVNS